MVWNMIRCRGLMIGCLISRSMIIVLIGVWLKVVLCVIRVFVRVISVLILSLPMLWVLLMVVQLVMVIFGMLQRLMVNGVRRIQFGMILVIIGMGTRISVTRIPVRLMSLR